MKPFKNLDEQIELLKAKNFCILDQDMEQIKLVLSSVSYYRLKGYSLKYNTKNHGQDDYNHKRFLDVIQLYNYDMQLRKILLYKIGQIEIKLRMIIAYTLGNISPDFHNEDQYWSNQYKFENWQSYTQSTINHSESLSAIHYHNDIHNMEIWVVMDEITLGNLINLFIGIKEVYQQEIIQALHIPQNSRFINAYHFSNLLQLIKKLRNSCCHFERIFDKNFIIRRKHNSNIRKNIRTINNSMDGVFASNIYNYDTKRKELIQLFNHINTI